MPDPLAAEAVRELLLAEAERQGAPALGHALAELVGLPSAAPPTALSPPGSPSPLAAAARYPLLAGWAVGHNAIAKSRTALDVATNP